MAIKINTEILDYVRSSRYSDDTKKFLIQALLLEFKRDKEDVKHYTKEYDNIIKKYVD